MVKKASDKSIPSKKSFMIADLLGNAHDNKIDITGRSPTNVVEVIDLSSTDDDSDDGERSPIAPQLERPHQPATEEQALSADQERLLTNVFLVRPSLSKKRRVKLAKEVNLTEEQISLWFRNKRKTAKNDQASARERSAKLAYINSLANSLLINKSSSQSARAPYRPIPYLPKPIVPQVPYSRVPMFGSHCQPFVRRPMVPAMYARRSSYRVSPYAVPYQIPSHF